MMRRTYQISLHAPVLTKLNVLNLYLLFLILSLNIFVSTLRIQYNIRMRSPFSLAENFFLVGTIYRQEYFHMILISYYFKVPLKMSHYFFEPLILNFLCLKTKAFTSCTYLMPKQPLNDFLFQNHPT